MVVNGTESWEMTPGPKSLVFPVVQKKKSRRNPDKMAGSWPGNLKNMLELYTLW